MHQQNIVLAGGLGNDEIAFIHSVLLQQQLANQAIFVGTKNVLSDGEEVLLAVHQFEREHGPIIQGRALRV